MGYQVVKLNRTTSESHKGSKSERTTKKPLNLKFETKATGRAENALNDVMDR